MNQSLDWVFKPAGITFKNFERSDLLSVAHSIVTMKRRVLTRLQESGVYSKSLEEWGFDPFPVYHELPETPYSEPEMAKEYPFYVTSKKADVYWHSGGRQIPLLRKMTTGTNPQNPS